MLRVFRRRRGSVLPVLDGGRGGAGCRLLDARIIHGRRGLHRRNRGFLGGANLRDSRQLTCSTTPIDRKQAVFMAHLRGRSQHSPEMRAVQYV